MADEARFVAFFRLGTSDPTFNSYTKFDTLDSFLLRATADLDSEDSIPNNELEHLSTRFDQAMKHAKAIFGDHAFRKWPLGRDHRPPLNRSLFDSWAVALALVPPMLSEQSAERLRQAARQAMTTNSNYIDSITFSTGTTEKVRARFTAAFNMVREHAGAQI